MLEEEWGRSVVVRRRLKLEVVSLLIASEKEDLRCPICGLLEAISRFSSASSGMVAMLAIEC